MEKSYEDGLRDGAMRALHDRIATIEKDTKDGFQQMTHELDILKKAVWLLYGAIGIVGFVLPLFQKWVGA